MLLTEFYGKTPEGILKQFKFLCEEISFFYKSKKRSFYQKPSEKKKVANKIRIKKIEHRLNKYIYLIKKY